MNIKKIIGDNVRGYRKKIGWTQEKLGVRSKLNSQYISRLELGQESIKAETLHKIAQTLKVDIGLFFRVESYKD